MNEGWVATRLGLKGLPRSAEEAMVARDIALAETTGGRLHVAHASTAGTVDLVRQAKARGLDVTCEATPHHLTLTDETVLGRGAAAYEPLSTAAYDTNAKVAPPLRSRSDVEAMVEGLRDGAVDLIATDHAPHGRIEKLCTFDEAANGISVLETALGSLMSLVHSGALTLPTLVDRLTAAPARFLGVDLGTLRPGSSADVTLFDPNSEWVVDPCRVRLEGEEHPPGRRNAEGARCSYHRGRERRTRRPVNCLMGDIPIARMLKGFGITHPGAQQTARAALAEAGVISRPNRTNLADYKLSPRHVTPCRKRSCGIAAVGTAAKRRRTALNRCF